MNNSTIDNDMDYYFDLRVYKSDIEVYLGKDISDEEFDKIIESFEIFAFDDVINSYIQTNKQRLEWIHDHNMEKSNE